MTILKARNLVKRYNNGFVLNIDSIDFQQGRVYGLVGPNGAGKSTLLNILNLLEQIMEGSIFFRNQKITDINSLNIRRKMSMVMEDPFLFNTTVFNNLTAGLRCRSIDKKMWTQMVDNALQMVGLAGFEKRYAPELSRGESQRVAIARTLILKPEILFMDEPFTNIDKKNINMLERLIRTINYKHNTTIIFTTHDLSQAYSLSDEVISLVDGKIIRGSIDNFFTGMVEGNDNLSFVRISSRVRLAIVTKKRGRVHVSIPPQDIILSYKEISSSARNSFKGIVKKILIENQKVKVNILVDNEVEFTVLITYRSYKDMNLLINSSVFLIFKSTSVIVF
ncbi:MAG: ABC transporter ATP-binding protein [Nitrospirota bacterium]